VKSTRFRIAKLLASLSIAIYAVAVPALELNDSHVFNPEWPPHARLHEVWQLITNSSMGAFCLWRVWAHSDLKLPAVLTSLILGGFLVAWMLNGSYGGDMTLGNGHAERTLLGVNIGILGATLALTCGLLAAWLGRIRGDAG
jgi:hypothetical protein